MTDAPLPPTNHQSPITDPEDEISLLDLAIVLAKHKTLILGLPFAAAVLAARVSLLLPNIYTPPSGVWRFRCGLI
jgi:LPS O-antigen subunit length determinant protein (WzzB/FepE family)